MKKVVARPQKLGIDHEARSKTQDVWVSDLWSTNSTLEATDPRDRVIALLSTQERVSMDFIDYSKDVATVYTEIAVIALTTPLLQTNWHRPGYSPYSGLPQNKLAEEPNRLCRFLSYRTTTSTSAELPSWVPDWRPPEFAFHTLSSRFPGSTFFASNYRHSSIEDEVRLNFLRIDATES